MRRLLSAVLAFAIAFAVVPTPEVAPEAQAFSFGRMGSTFGKLGYPAAVGAGGFDLDLNLAAGQLCSKKSGCLSAASALTSSRTVTAWAPWADGHWSTFVTNVPMVTDLGLWTFNAATNLLLQSRSPNTTWTKTTITAANANQTGIDNVANSAGTITATGANSTACQAVTSTSQAHTGSIFLRRLVGTGQVLLSVDGGSTYPLDVTAKLAEYAAKPFKFYRGILTQTLANPSLCVKIVTSGDSLAFDQAMLETGSVATAPITTTTAQGTRNNDVIRVNDPFKSEMQAACSATIGCSIFLENNSRITNSPAPTWFWMSAATTPASNNVKFSPDSAGGHFFNITNGNGHNQTVHVATVVQAEEIQRSAVSLQVNNQPYVTTVATGLGGTGGVFVPQAFQLTGDTLPNFVGGDVTIGGTTSGGTMPNDAVRRVAMVKSALPYSRLQAWTVGAGINGVPDPIINNKTLFNTTLASGVTTFPSIGVVANHRTNIVQKPIPDSTNLALIQATGSSVARIGWTWASIETQQASFTASLNTTAGGQMIVSSVSSCTLAAGQNIADAAAGVTPGTAITGQVSGSPGCAGTYSISISQTVASRSLTSTIYDWSQSDNLVQSLVAAGKKIVWVLNSNHPLYGVSGSALPTTTFQITAFANFGVSFVNHYAPLVGGSNITVEVQNEPNLGGPYLTASQYATLYNTVAAAIRAAQSSVKLASAGLGNQGQAAPNDPNSYITTFMAARTAPIDCVSNHPYNSGAFGNPEQMIAQTASFKAAAGGSTPVCNTESGYSLDWTGFSDARKASFVARSGLSTLIAQPVLWTLYDLVNDGTDSTDHESNFGLYDWNYNAQSSATAFSAITSLLASSSSYDVIQSPAWVYQVNFNQSSGATARVVWNYHMPASDIRHTVDAVSTTNLTVKDLLGRNVNYTLNGTLVTLLLNELTGPVVITSGNSSSCSAPNGQMDFSFCSNAGIIAAVMP